MKITYIGHSGFCVETKEYACIFDYYEGEIPEIAVEKSIYYFVSHKHEDHYNPSIFETSVGRENVTYILPTDMKMNEKYLSRKNIPEQAWRRIIYIKKNDELQVDGLRIHTLRSTDAGVAYIVEFSESGTKKRIYHAGDLNWWSWRGESKSEGDKMKQDYLHEIDQIKGETFDVAFVVLDPRQEDRYDWGFHAFMERTNPKQVVPMHCFEDYTIIDRLLGEEKAKYYVDRVVKIKQRGEQWEV